MTEKLNLLVTAGHPADAFDAVGGTIAQHTDRGDRVTVAVMTHGVKSHSWNLMAQERTAKASATEADVQAQIEIKEQEIRDGLSILGVKGDQVHFLGIDDAFLNSQRSDGLIASTPTGSTAYALSAGGPILSPRLNAIVLAPINPHTLTNRPIVVDSQSVIEASFNTSRNFGAQLVCDNFASPELEMEDRIIIRKAPRTFRLLHPLSYDFFEILRAKLNWSSGYREER